MVDVVRYLLENFVIGFCFYPLCALIGYVISAFSIFPIFSAKRDFCCWYQGFQFSAFCFFRFSLKSFDIE